MTFLDHLIQLFAAHGYLAVFVVLLVCGFGVPIPEDVSLVAGGIIAGLGYADVRAMGAVGLAGVPVGDTLVFLFGRHFGMRALRLRGVAHLLTPRRYARVQAKFERHGNRLMRASCPACARRCGHEPARLVRALPLARWAGGIDQRAGLDRTRLLRRRKPRMAARLDPARAGCDCDRGGESD